MKKKPITSYPEFYCALVGIFAFIGLGYISIGLMGITSLTVTGMNLALGNLGILDMAPMMEDVIKIPGIARLTVLVFASCVLVIIACANGNKSLRTIGSIFFLGSSVFYIVYFQFMFSDQLFKGMGGMSNGFSLFNEGKPALDLGAGMGLWISAAAALLSLFADMIFKGSQSRQAEEKTIKQPFADEFGTQSATKPAPSKDEDPFA